MSYYLILKNEVRNLLIFMCQQFKSHSKALAAWLFHFLFCIQATFHISDTAVSQILFSQFLDVFVRFQWRLPSDCLVPFIQQSWE